MNYDDYLLAQADKHFGPSPDECVHLRTRLTKESEFVCLDCGENFGCAEDNE